MILLPLIIFLFGLLIGSFLNVVILRMNTGRSVVVGRSKCAHCNRELAWYELIPVFSFLGLRAKCRTCKQPISFQYALVELTTAIVFVLAYTKIIILGGFTATAIIAYLFTILIASLLLVITVYDIRHKIIPDIVVYPFMILAVLSIVWRAVTLPGFHIFSALFDGALVALPFFFLWYFSKGRLMGFGDVKLMLGIGWLVGLSAGFTVLVLGFWIGGIFGLFLLALTKKYGMKSQIPFGPFLIIAVGVVALWGVTISSLFPIW